jgi:hypothetical protein
LRAPLAFTCTGAPPTLNPARLPAAYRHPDKPPPASRGAAYSTPQFRSHQSRWLLLIPPHHGPSPLHEWRGQRSETVPDPDSDAPTPKPYSFVSDPAKLTAKRYWRLSIPCAPGKPKESAMGRWWCDLERERDRRAMVDQAEAWRRGSGRVRRSVRLVSRTRLLPSDIAMIRRRLANGSPYCLHGSRPPTYLMALRAAHPHRRDVVASIAGSRARRRRIPMSSVADPGSASRIPPNCTMMLPALRHHVQAEPVLMYPIAHVASDHV